MKYIHLNSLTEYSYGPIYMDMEPRVKSDI